MQIGIPGNLRRPTSLPSCICGETFFSDRWRYPLKDCEYGKRDWRRRKGLADAGLDAETLGKTMSQDKKPRRRRRLDLKINRQGRLSHVLKPPRRIISRRLEIRKLEFSWDNSCARLRGLLRRRSLHSKSKLNLGANVGGILSGLTRGPVQLNLLARTKAHLGASPILNRHKGKDLEDVSWRT